MTTTPASAAIATLIEMAQQGEIDPWDVQVIDVIDRFLIELGLPDDLESSAHQQANLSRSGQTFLWASMLVLLKADTLESLERDDSSETVIEPELLETLTKRPLPLELERHIRRRSSAPPVRKRRVTLAELIQQLEQIGSELDKVSSSTGTKRNRSMSRSEALKVITQLAHQENLTELATQLDDFLRLKLPQLAPNKTSFELEELLYSWSQTKNDESVKTPDRVGIFWALLLLTSQSKVELSQTEFYQDLQIQVII